MELARRERTDVMEVFRRLLAGDVEGPAWLRTEEYLDDATLVVRVELPGIDPDQDVDISIAEGVLRITARREEKSEHKDKQSYRSEFRYGSFERVIPLPGFVNPSWLHCDGGIWPQLEQWSYGRRAAALLSRSIAASSRRWWRRLGSWFASAAAAPISSSRSSSVAVRTAPW